MAAVWNRVARCSTGCRSAETVFLEVSGAELAYFEDPCLMSLRCRWEPPACRRDLVNITGKTVDERNVTLTVAAVDSAHVL